MKKTLTELISSPEFNHELDLYSDSVIERVQMTFKEMKSEEFNLWMFSMLNQEGPHLKEILFDLTPVMKKYWKDSPGIESSIIDEMLRYTPIATCVVMPVSLKVFSLKKGSDEVMTQDADSATALLFESFTKTKMITLVPEGKILVPSKIKMEWSDKEKGEVEGVFSNLFEKASKRHHWNKHHPTDKKDIN